MIIPVILCGGSGTRLWPLSRQAYPKQLLPLISGYSLLQDTMLRVKEIAHAGTPIVICNEAHRFMVAEQLEQIGISNVEIILEPTGKNTAPAAAIAALQAQSQHADPLLLILPADHVIKNTDNFFNAIAYGSTVAEKKYLVTFGVVPTKPETGYGYIKKSEKLKFNDAEIEGFGVAEFVEKPNLALAEKYFLSGEYFWNSGMFLFQASQYLNQLQQFAPDILHSCQQAFAHLTQDLNFLRLDPTLFSNCRNDSIDYAVMEKSGSKAVIPLDAEWNDVGSWDAVWEVKESDHAGNVLQGDIYTDQVKNSYVHAESRMVAAIGISDHIIVETADAVLVAHKDHCQNVKTLVNHLKKKERSETELHRRVYRPWGFYEVLDISPHAQVKRIQIKPGARLSLQMHQHRSEHWVVIEGKALVTIGDQTMELEKNQSTYIPIGMKHRLENPGSIPLLVIEVQCGSYLGEDDIIRFEDVYGRETSPTG